MFGPSPQHHFRGPVRLALLAAMLAAVPHVWAAGATPVPTPTLRAEIDRGARAIAEIIARPYPYETTRRLIRGRLERNVQEGRDTDGFRLGAHIAAAFWVDHLAEDVPWRATALAQHRDVVQWLLPRAALPLTDTAHTVAVADGLSKESEQELLEFLQAIATPAPRQK